MTELLTKREKEAERLKERLDNTQQKLTRTKTYQQNRIQNLLDENQQITEINLELTNLNDTLNTLPNQSQKDKQKINKLTKQQQSLLKQRSYLVKQLNNYTCPTLPVHTCSPCPLIHLPEPHTCPNNFSCSHADYSQIKEQNDNYQQQLANQEQQIVQQLNTTFKLGLSPQEKNLQKAIIEISKLIAKPPLTVTDEVIKQELIQAQTTITKLEKELTEKTPRGENIKEIIQIDEQLLNRNQDLPIIELNKQISDYSQLAQERNKLVLAQIKQINVQKLCQIIPQVQKAEVQQTLAKANNYAELAQARNELIVKYLNSNQTLAQSLPVVPQKTERII